MAYGIDDSPTFAPSQKAIRFNAFISYSHAADGRLAPELQRALQRFARPWNKGTALRIFRDETDLSVNPALWLSVEQALKASEYFLLLASPDAGTSASHLPPNLDLPKAIDSRWGATIYYTYADCFRNSV